ncbi:MAG: hypothetical protein IID61_03565 [SAR324 cluster bacterium]|nr:hypothetical protein [SAR324 cluster bacterium]
MRQLIRNALIVTGDGTTDPFPGDALIDGERITHLGTVPEIESSGADRVIDAAGRVLAPGFIDCHNHGALGGTRIGKRGIPVACENAILAGVTKRICGTDGLSPAPVAEDQREDYALLLKPLDGEIGEPWTWSTLPEFYAWHRGRSVTDMGVHLGHSAVRRLAIGNVKRPAVASEVKLMEEVVRREAPHAIGFSTGLIYNPAVYSDQKELAALIRAFNSVKPGGFFPHIRNESDAILEALKEAIGAAIDGGGAYGNEHSKIGGPRNYDKIGQVEGMFDQAADNVPAMENMYIYTAGSTTGDAIFPPEFRSGSRDEFLSHLKSPTSRRAIYEWIRSGSATWENFVDFCGGLQGVQIAGIKEGVGDEFLGKRLGDVARARGFPDLDSFEAHNAVMDFFVDNDLLVTIISHHGDEPTVQRLFKRKTMAICTDGLMPGPGQKPHPRSIGSFPKALRYARELGVELKEIVHRMTVMPCAFFHLESPLLRPGADASLVLFDPETVREMNDYDDPYIPPQGIGHVWIHGVPVLQEAEIKVPDPYPGRILRTVAH